jgi:hypothetical protein
MQTIPDLRPVQAPPPKNPPQQRAFIQTCCDQLVKYNLATKVRVAMGLAWPSTRTSKYIPPPAFGKTGVSKRMFDDLHSSVRYSDQPERPAAMSLERYRWCLIDDLVRRFNEHRLQTFSPSDIVCVYESMSKGYGAGGHWINEGLLMYIAIDRKPENSCEIQTARAGGAGDTVIEAGDHSGGRVRTHRGRQQRSPPWHDVAEGARYAMV